MDKVQAVQSQSTYHFSRHSGFLATQGRTLVAIKQGGTAEAAIGGMIKTIDSIINRTLFLVAKWSP
jgi:hypothetical protein